MVLLAGPSCGHDAGLQAVGEAIEHVASWLVRPNGQSDRQERPVSTKGGHGISKGDGLKDG